MIRGQHFQRIAQDRNEPGLWVETRDPLERVGRVEVGNRPLSDRLVSLGLIVRKVTRQVAGL